MCLSARFVLATIAALAPMLVNRSAAQEKIADGQIRATAAGSVALIDAQLALQHAQYRLHQYRYVDYPRQRHKLDDAIKLTEAEIKLLDRRIIDYRPFRTVGRYSPTYTAEQDYRHYRLATKQQLKQLRDQRVDHWRYHADRCRLLELEVLRAAAVLRGTQQDVGRSLGG